MSTAILAVNALSDLPLDEDDFVPERFACGFLGKRTL
jgi:hypothetical protein